MCQACGFCANRQGGGKRKGAVAVYLEPWHADVYEFLELRKNHGKEEQRARDLFYGALVGVYFRCWTLNLPCHQHPPCFSFRTKCAGIGSKTCSM